MSCTAKSCCLFFSHLHVVPWYQVLLCSIYDILRVCCTALCKIFEEGSVTDGLRAIPADKFAVRAKRTSLTKITPKGTAVI